MYKAQKVYFSNIPSSQSFIFYILLYIIMFFPMKKHHQHGHESDASHSVPVPLVFLEFPNAVFYSKDEKQQQ
jgi:hypothetical protein